MMKLSTKDYNLLNFMMSLPEKDLHETLFAMLLQYYDEVIESKEDYILAEGKIPVVLVAHLDTVEEHDPKYQMLYDEKKGILASLFGLGFDDRAGVAAIIKILDSGFRPSIILTHGEEKGCLGSDQLIKDYPDYPFKDKAKYMIQIDRRGKNDCVFYWDDNTEFVRYVESFGYYKDAMGSFTDIATLAPAWGISAVNLSTGYYNEHTHNEYLVASEWYQTIEQVKIMLREIDDAPYFEYREEMHRYLYKTKSHYTYEDAGWEYAYTDYCDNCLEEYPYDTLEEVIMPNGVAGLFCPTCFKAKADMCDECGDFYVKEDNSNGLCVYCREKEKYKKISYYHR